MPPQLIPHLVTAGILIAAATLGISTLRAIERIRSDRAAAALCCVLVTIAGSAIFGIVLVQQVDYSTPRARDVVQADPDPEPATAPGQNSDPVLSAPPEPEPAPEPVILTTRTVVLDLQKQCGIVYAPGQDITEMTLDPERYVIGAHPDEIRGLYIYSPVRPNIDAHYISIPGDRNYDSFFERLPRPEP